LKLVLAVASFLSLTPTASAQDYLGSFLESDNFGRSQGSSGVNRPNYRPHQRTAQLSQTRMNELMRRLRPEYERRVLRNGKTSADGWHKRTAYRLGVEEGRRARP
jgi:hypothetical protein